MLRVTFSALAMSLALSSVMVTTASAAPVKNVASVGIKVSNAWIRVVPPVSDMSAAYLVISNTGKKADTLLSASSPAFEDVELHDTFRDGDKSGMRPVGEPALPPGARVELAPGGKHLMLMGIRKPLVAGDKLPIELKFKSGIVKVDALVKDDEPEAQDAHTHHHH